MGGGGFAEWPRLPLDFPGDSVKNLPATKETPWVGKTPPGGGHDDSLQCAGRENPRDRGAWWAAVRGVTRLRHS